MPRRRYLYVLLFAVPALLLSTTVAAMAVAAASGVLWLFVLGDNHWPPAANTALGGMFLLSAAGLWLLLLAVAYGVGTRQESLPALNGRHVALSIGATAVLVAVIVARLMGLSLSGTKSESLTCADLCQSGGFSGSSLPPQDSGDRTCSCYDATGREVRRILLP